MENFEEKLKARTEAIKAKIAKGMLMAEDAIVHAEQTAQKFKDFAEELHQEKLEKLKALLEQAKAKAEV